MSVPDAVSVIAAFVVIAWFVRFIATGRPERDEEDSARAFFDRHGHWPDEDPAERT